MKKDKRKINARKKMKIKKIADQTKKEKERKEKYKNILEYTDSELNSLPY